MLSIESQNACLVMYLLHASLRGTKQSPTVQSGHTSWLPIAWYRFSLRSYFFRKLFVFLRRSRGLRRFLLIQKVTKKTDRRELMNTNEEQIIDE
nr:hypothetical protein [Mucilaginibacter sp. X5P1]